MGARRRTRFPQYNVSWVAWLSLECRSQLGIVDEEQGQRQHEAAQHQSAFKITDCHTRSVSEWRVENLMRCGVCRLKPTYLNGFAGGIVRASVHAKPRVPGLGVGERVPTFARNWQSGCPIEVLGAIWLSDHYCVNLVGSESDGRVTHHPTRTLVAVPPEVAAVGNVRAVVRPPSQVEI